MKWSNPRVLLSQPLSICSRMNRSVLYNLITYSAQSASVRFRALADMLSGHPLPNIASAAMKIILVFLLCLVGAFADSTNTSHSSKNDEWRSCIIERAPNPDAMESPTEDQRNCFLACLYRKIGYMKEDGTFDVESRISNSAGEKRKADTKKFIEIVETCELQAGDDVCKRARCYYDQSLASHQTVSDLKKIKKRRAWIKRGLDP